MRVLDHLAVIVPATRNVAIYLRRFPDQRLRLVKYTDSVDELHDVVSQLTKPRLVVFVGSSYHGYLESLRLAEKTALCIIPGAWVQHIPPQNDTHRARFAVQLIEAHVNEPIQLMRSGTKLPL